MRTKEGFISILFLAFIATGFWFSLKHTDRPAPDETFTTITGQNITLTDWLGKPVIITFWATDCPGCIEEIPHLIELYNQFHPQGLEILAITMYYDPPNHVVEMTQAKQLPYFVALDLKAEHAKAFGDVRLTPTSFLLAPDGTIEMHKIGVFDLEDMKNRIENLLKENNKKV